MRIKLLADTFLGIAALLVFQSCAETTMAAEDTAATKKNTSALRNASSFNVPVAGNSVQGIVLQCQIGTEAGRKGKIACGRD